MQHQSERLVKMANQIGQFFESQSAADPATAAQAVAAHLKSYWTPGMRADLVGQVERGEVADLLPVVARAVRMHRGTLITEGAPLPAAHQSVFPQGGGDAG